MIGIGIKKIRNLKNLYLGIGIRKTRKIRNLRKEIILLKIGIGIKKIKNQKNKTILKIGIGIKNLRNPKKIGVGKINQMITQDTPIDITKNHSEQSINWNWDQDSEEEIISWNNFKIFY